MEDKKTKEPQFVGFSYKIIPVLSDREKKEKGEKPKKPTLHTPFPEVGENFTTRLQLLWQYIKQIGGVAEATTVTNMGIFLF